MDNLHIFLGATVADAATRPLHWVYDPKKLNYCPDFWGSQEGKNYVSIF